MPVVTVITNTFRKRWRPARAEPAVPVLVFPGPARIAADAGTQSEPASAPLHSPRSLCS